MAAIVTRGKGAFTGWVFGVSVALASFSPTASAQLFVADGDQVLAVQGPTGIRSLVSGPGRGSGTAFVSLTGIAVQGPDTLFVMDEVAAGTTMRVVKVDIATGNRTTLSETGDGNGEDWTEAHSLAFDEHGNLFTHAPGVGILRWALSGGEISPNRLKLGHGIAGGFDLAPSDDDQNAYITDRTGEFLQGSSFPGEFPAFILSGGPIGAGEPFESPAGIWRASDVALLVANSGPPGALLLVDPSDGTRFTVSGGVASLGSGPSFDTPIDTVRNEAGTIFVLDQGLPAIFRVNLTTGERTVISGFNGSSIVSTGPNLVAPTAFAPSVSVAATAGPNGFDTSNILGMGFRITGGTGNDETDELSINAFISPDFPTAPATIDFEDGGVTAVLDANALPNNETIQVNGLGHVYGGAYAGATGNVRLDSVGGIIFDDSHPGSYVYTRFGLSGTPAESSERFNVPTTRADSYLVIGLKRSNQDGDVTGEFLFRDGDDWFTTGDFPLPGTGAPNNVLAITLEWPGIAAGLSPLNDPVFEAELDAVMDGGEPGFAGTQSGMGIAVWKEIGETMRLSVPNPINTGAPVTWRRNGFLLSNGGRISGATTRTLQIVDLQSSDSGSYTAEYDDGAKAFSLFGPAFVQVFAPGSLPIAGALSLGLMAAGIVVGGVWMQRRRK